MRTSEMIKKERNTNQRDQVLGVLCYARACQTQQTLLFFWCCSLVNMDMLWLRAFCTNEKEITNSSSTKLSEWNLFSVIHSMPEHQHLRSCFLCVDHAMETMKHRLSVTQSNLSNQCWWVFCWSSGLGSIQQHQMRQCCSLFANLCHMHALIVFKVNTTCTFHAEACDSDVFFQSTEKHLNTFLGHFHICFPTNSCCHSLTSFWVFVATHHLDIQTWWTRYLNEGMMPIALW